MKSFLLSVLFVFSAQFVNAQCPVICNAHINFAIDVNVLTEVEADVVLEGSYANCANFTPVVALSNLTTGVVLPTSPYLSADEVGTEVLATVTDVSTGNACWGKIIVESIGSLTSGIFNCSGKPLTNVNLHMNATSPNVTIDDQGCVYSGGNLLDYVNCVAAQNTLSGGVEYIISPSSNGDYINGVSTLDQVFTIKHILALTPFDNPCQLIAADVTNDGKITAFDIIIMRRLILHIATSFPNSPSWKFLNTSALETNDFGTEHDLIFGENEFPLSELRITGIKIGDVNGTALTGN